MWAAPLSLLAAIAARTEPGPPMPESGAQYRRCMVAPELSSKYKIFRS